MNWYKDNNLNITKYESGRRIGASDSVKDGSDRTVNILNITKYESEITP